MSGSKDIFISYRREGGEFLASLLYQRLSSDGYSVFLDVESLRSGKFNEQLFRVIEECTDFLLILPPNGLDRCVHPDDWVRLEIERAVDLGKNIIPVMMRGFEWPDTLPEKLQEIPLENGVTANTELFDGVIARLEKKLLRSKAQVKDEKQLPVSQKLKDMLQNADYERKESPVVRTIRQKKEQKFFQSFEQRNREQGSKKMEVPCDDTAELGDPQKYGRYFSVIDGINDNTIIYQIIDCYDEKMLVKYGKPDRLIRASKQSEGYWIRTYYIPPEDMKEDDGLSLVFLTFKDLGEKIDIYVNTGILKRVEVKITKNPALVSSVNKTTPPRAGNYSLGNLNEDERELFSSGQGAEKYWEEKIGELNCIIIDPLTLEEPQREVYFDEEKNRFAARVKLKNEKSYFAFAINFKDGGYEEPLTNLEIGSAYRTGSHGFPKDLLKAGNYLEKDGSADALYQIGLMFLNEGEIWDEEIALSYFQRAVELGSEQAKEIFATSSEI